MQGRLDEFLEELIEPIGRSERRHWAGVFVQGLLLDGERKSVQPMAARLAGADEQALNQFLNQSPWAATGIQQRLAQRLGEDGHEPVYWMVEETSFAKTEAHSVGAARRYCGTLAKIANCQVAVSLHWRQAQLSWPRITSVVGVSRALALVLCLKSSHAVECGPSDELRAR